MKINNNNILKQNWERGHDFIDLSQADIQNIITPFTNQEINSIKLCATGCANTNYILEFTDKSKLMLRIYTRDSSAISREQFIYKLIIVAVVIIIAFDFTIGKRIDPIVENLNRITDEQGRKELINKLRKEMNKGLEKEFMLKEDDRVLIYNFFNKLMSEINSVEKN